MMGHTSKETRENKASVNSKDNYEWEDYHGR